MYAYFVPILSLSRVKYFIWRVIVPCNTMESFIIIIIIVFNSLLNFYFYFHKRCRKDLFKINSRKWKCVEKVVCYFEKGWIIELLRRGKGSEAVYFYTQKLVW